MAINFPNFLQVPIQKPDYSGLSDAIANYYAGKKMPQDNLINAVKAEFARPNAEADLESTRLKNIYQELVNQFTPEDYRSQFAARKALSDYRNMGDGRGGVTAQQQMVLINQLKRDNPGLTDEQAFEAAGNLVNGQQTLNDGTPFKVSGLTNLTASKAVMQGTTSALATQGTKAAQADAELSVLNDYAQKGLEPYGDTFAGMNPDQVLDTFKTDKDSQKKLGRFIAAQALQYEAAQNRIRLANGQPGVNSTEELMQMSGQLVKARYPRLSDAARKEAARYMDEALRQGLEARKKVGILQSGLTGAHKKSSYPQSIEDESQGDNEGIVDYKIVNGKLVRS